MMIKYMFYTCTGPVISTTTTNISRGFFFLNQDVKPESPIYYVNIPLLHLDSSTRRG